MGYAIYHKADSKEIIRFWVAFEANSSQLQSQSWAQINSLRSEPIPVKNRGFTFFDGDWLPVVGATLEFNEAGELIGQIVPRLPLDSLHRELDAITEADESARELLLDSIALQHRTARGTENEFEAAALHSRAKDSNFKHRVARQIAAVLNNAALHHNHDSRSDIFGIILFVAARVVEIIRRTHGATRARLVCQAANFESALAVIAALAPDSIAVILGGHTYDRRARKIVAGEPGAVETAIGEWAEKAAVGVEVEIRSGRALLTAPDDPRKFGDDSEAAALDANNPKAHQIAVFCAEVFGRGDVVISAPQAASGEWLALANKTALDLEVRAGANVLTTIRAFENGVIAAIDGANGLALRLVDPAGAGE